MKKRLLPVLLIVCGILMAALVVLQLIIDHMDEHEPFRRVGLPNPKIPLDETLQWLKGAIQGTEVDYTTNLAGRKAHTAERQEEVTFSGCAMTIKITDLTFETQGYQIAFDLSEIASAGRPIKIVSGDKVFWKVALHTVDYRDVIQERSGLTSYTSLNVAEPQMAQRVVNAINHAAQLCQNVRKPASRTSGMNAPSEPSRPENISSEKSSR